jgi:hypothetical protein
MNHKITNLRVLVPYKSSGGIVHQREVEFDLFKSESHYSLKPLLSAHELEVANLPPELNFEMVEGKPVSLRGKRDGNLHVIQDAVALLEKQQTNLA